jgi:hypothetical protein
MGNRDMDIQEMHSKHNQVELGTADKLHEGLAAYLF